MHGSKSDRVTMIARSFAKIYFGHVSVEMAAWGELEMFLDTFLAGARDIEDLEALQSSLAETMTEHKLVAFPVSPRHKSRVTKWLCGVFERNGVAVTQPKMLSLAKAENERTAPTEEPEYIFKTFERYDDVFVTLLEENRNVIGQGTTGLTSWQGGLFLADWCENQAHFLKVGILF